MVALEKMKLSEQKISDLKLSDTLITCRADTKVRDVIIMLREARIGSMVIVDDDKRAIGIFTERDYLFKFPLDSNADLDGPISAYMTANPKSVKKDDSIYRASVFMRVGRFRHLVVEDEDQKVDTMVSVRDIVDYVIDQFE